MRTAFKILMSLQ